ncbi:MAG: hypothetical protein Q8Q62_14810 [Mesorhizobium sp.]|nr:hypothetical protein [Mesorhizobium sp.]
MDKVDRSTFPADQLLWYQALMTLVMVRLQPDLLTALDKFTTEASPLLKSPEGNVMARFTSAAVLIAALASVPSVGHTQSFSCSMGQPSCINYNEKVVKRDAQCFDAYTCNFGGFICKSDGDRISEKAKRIASAYDDLRRCLNRANDIEDVNACIRTDNLRSIF